MSPVFFSFSDSKRLLHLMAQMNVFCAGQENWVVIKRAESKKNCTASEECREMFCLCRVLKATAMHGPATTETASCRHEVPSSAPNSVAVERHLCQRLLRLLPCWEGERQLAYLHGQVSAAETVWGYGALFLHQQDSWNLDPGKKCKG